MSVRREGSAWPGHVERLPDASIEHSVEDGVRVVRVSPPGQSHKRVDADVTEAVERHAAQPVNNGRVSIAGARVSVERSEELDRDGRPLMTRVTIR